MPDPVTPTPRSHYFILYQVYLEDEHVALAKIALDNDEDPPEEFVEEVEDEVHSQSSAFDPVPPFDSLDRSTWIDDEAYHLAYHLLKHSELREMATNDVDKWKVRMALLYALDELTS